MGLDHFKTEKPQRGGYDPGKNKVKKSIPDIQDEELEFFLGFFAADGYVMIAKAGEYYSPALGIKLMKRDRDILEEFENILSEGNFHEDRNSAVEWEIRDQDSCYMMVRLIETYIENNPDCMFTHTSKYESFLKWSDLVEILWRNKYDKKKRDEIIESGRGEINSH